MGAGNSRHVLTAAETAACLLTAAAPKSHPRSTNAKRPRNVPAANKAPVCDQKKAPDRQKEAKKKSQELEPSQLILRNQHYQEADYYTAYRGETPGPSISDADCFTAAVVYPEYCESTRSLIAHSVRESAARVCENDEVFQNGLEYVEQMEFCHQRAVDHCGIRRKRRELAKKATIVGESSHLELSSRGVTYDEIMNLLRNQWLFDHSSALSSVITNINSNFHVSKSEMERNERLKHLISAIFGCSDNDVLEALLPVSESLDKSECQRFLREIYTTLYSSKIPPVCLPEAPLLLSRFKLAKNVLRNGICSNGSFLFLLTTDLDLEVYKLYKGTIDHLYTSYDVGARFTDIQSTSSLFCTQKHLIINNKSSEISVLIDDIVSERFHFVPESRPTNDRVRVVSNGVTYMTASQDTMTTWDSVNLSNMWSRTERFEDNTILLSNGSFLLSIYGDGKMASLPSLNAGTCDTIDFDGITGEIQAGCLDIISDTIHLVEEKDGIFTLLTYHNGGPTDRSLLRFQPKIVFEARAIECISKLLWSYISHFAFGEAVPDNLLITDNAEKEMSKLTKLIVGYDTLRLPRELVFSLIVLVDLNLHRHKNPEILKQVLDMLTQVGRDSSSVFHTITVMVLANHIDSFVTNLDRLTVMSRLREALIGGNTFRDQLLRNWILQRIFYSKSIWKLAISAEEMDHWIQSDWGRPVSPKDIGHLDFFLLYQETLIDETARSMEDKMKNGSDGPVIPIICEYAESIFSRFEQFLASTEGSIASNSLSFILVNNFLMLLPAAIDCVQLARVVADHVYSIMAELSGRDSCDGVFIGIFIGYLYLVYAQAISTLIRGGISYQHEDDYWWLLGPNFYNREKCRLPNCHDDLVELLSWTESCGNERVWQFIENGRAQMNSIWEQNAYRIAGNRQLFERYDKVIILAFCHQLGLLDQLEHLHEGQSMNPHFRAVVSSITTIRRDFQKILQTVRQGNESNKALVARRLTNIGILLMLDPALDSYSHATGITQEMFLKDLKRFIYENDPEVLCHILESLPMRPQFISAGFENLNKILRAIDDETFQRLLVSGISRVNNFDSLDRVLSMANMDLTPNLVDELTNFSALVLEKGSELQLLPVLEVFFRLSVSCSNLKDLAIQAMNILLPMISDERNTCLMYLVGGIVMETGIIPLSVEKLPLRQRLILTLCAANAGSAPESLLLDCVLDIFKSTEWTTDEFYLRYLLRSLCSENVSIDVAGQVLQRVFVETCGAIGQKFQTFVTYGEVILGFRKILKSNTASSAVLMSILTEVQPSDVKGVFVLLSIVSLNLACYDVAILTEDENGFQFMSQHRGRRVCRQVPMTPYSQRTRIAPSEVVKAASNDEWNNLMQLPWDRILSFWDTCLSTRGRILSRLYLATILKYVRNPKNELSKEQIQMLMEEMAPYTDYYNLMEECRLYYLLIGPNPREQSHFSLLPRGEDNRSKGIGFIIQNGWEHTLIYNIFERGNAEIQAMCTSEGYIVLHNHRKVVVHVPSWSVSGSGEVTSIPFSEDRTSARLQVVPHDKTVIINGARFFVDPNAPIEFIARSPDRRWLVMCTGDPPGFPSKTDENASLQQMSYEGNLLESPKTPLSFPPEFNVAPVVVHELTVPIEEREPYQDILCADIQDSLVDMRQPVSCSAAVYEHLIEKNEIMMSSQLKTSILVEVASQDPKALSLNDRVLILASCIPALFRNRSFDKSSFPMELDIGLIDSISMNAIMDDTIAAVLHMLRLSVESKDFLNELGRYVVQLARSKELHCMSRKRDMLFVPSGLNPSENATKEGIRIEFLDGSSGIIQQDSWGHWSADTPIVFLTLLWILIDNCKTSEQRINAKLALIDSWIVGSPMIKEVLLEFLMYMQRKMTFTPFDFNEEYIHHLAWAASKFHEDYSITCFYRFEKHCFDCQAMVMAISRKFLGSPEVEPPNSRINLDKPLEIDGVAKSVGPQDIQIFRTLMRHYDSFDDFPIWDFLPLWNAIGSLNTYEPDSDTVVVEKDMDLCEFTLRNTSKTDTYLVVDIFASDGFTIEELDQADTDDRAIDRITISDDKHITVFKCYLRKERTRHFKCPENYPKLFQKLRLNSFRVCKRNPPSHSEMIRDAQLFSSWTNEDYQTLLHAGFQDCRYQLYWTYVTSFHVVDSLVNLQEDLVQRYGQRVVRCKLACMFIQNCVWTYLSQKPELSSRFDVVLSDNPLARIVKDRMYLSTTPIVSPFDVVDTPMVLDFVKAREFNQGNSKRIKDAMVFQLAKGRRHRKPEDFVVFQSPVWGVIFKGQDAADGGGPTKEALALGVASFLSANSGLCVTIPNNADQNQCDIIPFPSQERLKNVKETEQLYYMFGTLLGAAIVLGLYQDVPFPSFIWEMLAGHRLNSEWILKNDRDLAFDIEQMRGEYDETHPWTYREWNGEVKKISGFQTETVQRRQVDAYENAVLHLRTRSIEHWVEIIRSAFVWTIGPAALQVTMGASFSFACQGLSKIDIEEVVDRLEFRNGNKEQEEAFKSVLLAFDQEKMAHFLQFVTSLKRLGRETKIKVVFAPELSPDYLPGSHTCSNTIDIPPYPNTETLREKLVYAIQNCVELANF